MKKNPSDTQTRARVIHEPNEGIEILHTPECLAWEEALINAKAALMELEIDEMVHEVVITTMDEAETYGFFASPTLHINGTDADPKARRITKVGLGNDRPYFWGGHSLSAPPPELIKQALQELWLTDHFQ